MYACRWAAVARLGFIAATANAPHSALLASQPGGIKDGMFLVGGVVRRVTPEFFSRRGTLTTAPVCSSATALRDQTRMC